MVERDIEKKSERLRTGKKEGGGRKMCLGMNWGSSGFQVFGSANQKAEHKWINGVNSGVPKRNKYRLS